MIDLSEVKKTATCVVIAISSLCAAVTEAKEWHSVTIATEAAYEPWNLTLPGGAIGGFEPELMADLCNRIKIQCTLQAQDWDGMIAGLQVGKFDMLMDAIVITPQRQQIIAFSTPYASTQGVLVAADKAVISAAGPSGQIAKLNGDPIHDKPTIDALRALVKGKTVGIQSGTAYTQFVETHFNDIATIRVYKKSGEHVMDLLAGRIDFAFDDVTFFSSIMDKPENQSLAYVGPKIGGSIWGPGEALAYRQSDPELKAKFDDALRSALADGTVKTLSEKWFKADITP
ncbi:MAG: transporter substrate-binding protein [Pseudomonas sp.]|nr:transporter substrate-binding protein [Pseudomonas sp.]